MISDLKRKLSVFLAIFPLKINGLKKSLEFNLKCGLHIRPDYYKYTIFTISVVADTA
jgi:hypothetical protein